jgi:malate dehydrogenase (oxaloacetate-decarboxylating)(NADP+)
MVRRRDALEYHASGRKGKIEVVATKPLLTQRDLALAYTPGVAEPCLEIAREPDKVYEYTARGNLVAVISDGTAVLGLGNIGPEAGKPVMEGKGCLFKKFADIDVFDLELRTADPKNPDLLIEAIAALEPTFGGINLEDIKAPECFYIEEKLRQRMQIPVFHDDQHGTAIISGAALLNALAIQKKDIAVIEVVVNGAGASAIACANFYISLGVRPEHVTLVDSTGVIFVGRTEGMNPYKQRFARATSARTLADAMVGADLFLGCSAAGLVTKEMIASMNDRPIVFALANPDPEISYEDAVSVRTDIIMATGRSDYPNQVNNVLGFPFIFRGALDVRAREINEAMKVAAARALAALAREEVPERVSQAYDNAQFKFGPEYIIPKPFDSRVLWWLAPAVAKAAMDSGVARIQIDLDAYRAELQRRIQKTPALIQKFTARAREAPRRIVFPDGDQVRVLRACQQIVDEGIARPILLGPPDRIQQTIADLELHDLGDKVEIINPEASPHLERYADAYWKLRERKGVSREYAQRVLRRRNQYGLMMVKLGDADGLVGGLTNAYAETVLPALQIIGRAPGVSRISGVYIMVMPSGDVKFFADATVNVRPDASTLAETAIQVADLVRSLDIVPRIAMISYSTFGSADHPEPRRMAEAVELVRQRRPELEIEGELQVDVAVDHAQLTRDYPFARLTDAANILVFPDLNSGNVAYKLMNTLGGGVAVGPILLGIAKAVTVMPRNSSTANIVDMTAFTVLSAGLK